jgi:hypothetical protein
VQSKRTKATNSKTTASMMEVSATAILNSSRQADFTINSSMISKHKVTEAQSVTATKMDKKDEAISFLNDVSVKS